MWESDGKGWILLERFISLIGLLVLVFGVLRALGRIESNQARQHKETNATLEAIRERMRPDTWQEIEPSLQKSK
jgi:uncharacterized membrane protein